MMPSLRSLSLSGFLLVAVAAVLPSADPPVGSSVGTGLAAAYYATMDLSGPPVLTRIDPTLSFAWGAGSPAPSVPVDHFSATWGGWLEPVVTGSYTIHINSDNGRRVIVDGKPLIDKWIDDSGCDYSGTLDLVAGVRVEILVQYFENNGAAGIKLEWEAPAAGLARQVIPTTSLYPQAAPLPQFGTGTGLCGLYYANETLSGAPLVMRTDATVSFSWGASAPAPSLPVDSFSASWDGEIQPCFTEDLTLIARTDDGVRVWLNGNLVINAWGLRGAADSTYTFPGVAGEHYVIHLEYFEHTGSAVASLLWSSIHQPRVTIPTTQLYPVVPTIGTGTGLRGFYYANETLTAPAALIRTDSVINFNWGSAAPDPTLPADSFSACWNGEIQPCFSEDLTLIARTDDGVRVWLNGALVIDAWVLRGPTDSTYTFPAVAGQHYSICMEYYEHTGSASASLQWSSLHRPRAVIPVTQLYPVAQDPVIGTGTGLAAAYFPGPTFTGTPSYQTDPSLNFSWSTVPIDNGNFPADGFTIRWQGSIQSSYSNLPTTLIFTIDDAVRIWLDGDLVIDSWASRGTRELRCILPANANAHDLRIDYYDYNGTAIAKLEWENQNWPRRFVPASQLYPAAQVLTPALSSGVGISAEYYANETLAGTPRRRRDATLDFNWGSGSPGLGLPAENFSARWVGGIQTRYDEDYTLITTSDDGLRLWLDGVQVINDWNLHGAKEDRYTFHAQAGRFYSLKVEFYEHTGSAVARLEWQSVSEARQVVPEACLYPRALDLDLPVASPVSPAFAEGSHGQGLLPQTTVGSLVNLGDISFMLNIPLTISRPTAVTVTAGTAEKTGEISWAPTSLTSSKNMVIRPGDSLLFTSVVPGTWSVMMNSGALHDATPIAAGDLVPVVFQTPGYYQVIFDGSANSEHGVITIRVPGVSVPGPIACENQFKRDLDISLSNDTDSQIIVWSAVDPWISVGIGMSPADALATQRRLTIQPTRNRSSCLLARVPSWDMSSAPGPILLATNVLPFILYTNAEKVILLETQLADGSKVAMATMTISPLIRGIDINLYSFIAGITLMDGSTEAWYTTNDFIYDALTNIGTYGYGIIRAPNNGHGFCHAWRAFQNHVPISR